jgi:hypothetical protein
MAKDDAAKTDRGATVHSRRFLLILGNAHKADSTGAAFRGVHFRFDGVRQVYGTAGTEAARQ